MHKSIERYYCSLKDNGEIESLNTLEELFEECIRMDLERVEVSLIYKKVIGVKA